jgi:hypothetical protein
MGGNMVVEAIYDAIACFEIEVPDDATEDDISAIANEFLNDNYGMVCDAISESEVAFKEAY